MDLGPVLTGGGIITLLALLIGYLLNANWRDRTQQQSVLTELRTQIREQAKEYEDRLRNQSDDYEKRLTALESKYAARIEALDKRVDDLEKEVDGERRQRFTAEIRAAQLESQLAMLRAMPGETGA
jgi:hypothetical protein